MERLGDGLDGRGAEWRFHNPQQQRPIRGRLAVALILEQPHELGLRQARLGCQPVYVVRGQPDDLLRSQALDEAPGALMLAGLYVAQAAR